MHTGIECTTEWKSPQGQETEINLNTTSIPPAFGPEFNDDVEQNLTIIGTRRVLNASLSSRGHGVKCVREGRGDAKVRCRSCVRCR
jgi:hypothetical protein